MGWSAAVDRLDGDDLDESQAGKAVRQRGGRQV
jgi:hypothetical protein